MRAIRIPINRLDKKFLESRFAINIVEVNAFPNRGCFEIYDDSKVFDELPIFVRNKGASVPVLIRSFLVMRRFQQL